ncbi:MAG: HlyD family efflux transporter periplasmic adaptor subunit [Actinomycetota bacterium]|nr:HlyD family efflux transporter periplasmic adaptor subunit [Actinomycetota bacterium]
MTRRLSRPFGGSHWLNFGLVALLVLVLAGGWYFIFAPKSTATTSRTATVATGTVTATVTASGTVESSGNYELSFTTNGTVTAVDVETGDKVKAGQALVRIDSSAASQQLASAKSSYAQALTSLSQSNLTLEAAQQAVTDAKANSLANATSYQQNVDKAQLDLDQANAGASAACFNPASQPNSSDCANSQAWASLRNAEAAITSAQLDQQKAQSQAALNMNGYNAAISQAITSDAVTNATNARDKGVLSDQAAINTAITNLFKANVALLQVKDTLTKAAVSAQQAYNTAVLNQQKGIAQDLQTERKAEQSLASTQASSKAPKELGVASVAAASAAASREQLSNVQRAYAQTTLRAPVAGTIGAVNATVGQSSASSSGTTGSSSVITLVGKGELDVTSNFNEADAAKVTAGMSATITFTALPTASATGKVISVSPVSSTSNGLTTYPVIISIDKAPKGVLAGMTASVSVATSEASNVLVVPSTAITTLGGSSTVTVKRGDQETVVQVVTGVKGDSTTEITSGLTAGDVIVLPTAATSSTGFPTGGIPGGRTTAGTLTGGGLAVGGPPQ